MKRYFCLLTILIAVVAWRTGMALTVEEVVNPKAASDSFVMDEAGVLGPEYISLIDGVCRKLEAKTSAELAVVTVGDLGGITVEDFAVGLFKRFGIGKKGKDNGVLILFSRDDKKVRLEVGYGLEGTINDAKAGRLLDAYAIPKFKDGEYARGLYDLTKETALIIAKGSGATLEVADPEAWPAQVSIEASAPERAPPEILNVKAAVIVYVTLFLGASLLSLAVVVVRVLGNKAMAAKKRALGKGRFVPVVAFFVGAVVMFMIGAGAEKVLIPLAGYIGTAAVAFGSQLFLRKRLERYIKGYRLNCDKCKAPMDMVDEISDNEFLEAEEVAEEKAGGMDYEFWKCPKCGFAQRFNVKLPGADKCPKCGRRTLTETRTTLVAATTSSSGKERIDHDCRNPKCGHHFEKLRTIPKISSSSGSSGGSSGGSSFGGGSSGGGGASRGW